MRRYVELAALSLTNIVTLNVACQIAGKPTAIIAATRLRQLLLRVVRCLPSCARLQDATELGGQASDKPRGRKPRVTQR